jgi:Fe-Mn family superoxide dismutase
MTYTLPNLPYAYDALEPYIDTRTMEIHYTKHHQTYVNNLNKALEAYPDLQNIPLADLLSNLTMVPPTIRTAIQNNGGGHYNHSFFWLVMKPNAQQEPVGHLADEITKHFGSFKEFQTKFNAAATTVFGSGWAWLCMAEDGQLKIVSTANQDSPLSQGLKPVLGLDVWEHAYYLHYQNRRPDYINAWWHVINWEHVADTYEVFRSNSQPIL